MTDWAAQIHAVHSSKLVSLPVDSCWVVADRGQSYERQRKKNLEDQPVWMAKNVTLLTIPGLDTEFFLFAQLTSSFTTCVNHAGTAYCWQLHCIDRQAQFKVNLAYYVIRGCRQLSTFCFKRTMFVWVEPPPPLQTNTYIKCIKAPMKKFFCWQRNNGSVYMMWSWQNELPRGKSTRQTNGPTRWHSRQMSRTPMRTMRTIRVGQTPICRMTKMAGDWQRW